MDFFIILFASLPVSEILPANIDINIGVFLFIADFKCFTCLNDVIAVTFSLMFFLFNFC